MPTCMNKALIKKELGAGCLGRLGGGKARKRAGHLLVPGGQLRPTLRPRVDGTKADIAQRTGQRNGGAQPVAGLGPGGNVGL